MGANDIAEDEFRRIHAIVPSRDVRLRARLHGEIFRTRKILFLGRGKIWRKKIALARSRVHTHRREDSWDLN